MKQGLIEARVTRLENISDRIKDFVQEKSANNFTPFNREEENLTTSKRPQRAKRSLTDWRQLYEQKPNKINPSFTVYPFTAEGERARCSMTGQCIRNKRNYNTAKAKSFAGDHSNDSRNSKRQKLFQSKRESLIDFAFAQNCYENDLLKESRAQTAKEKHFYIKRGLDSKRGQFLKMGQFLSQIKPDIQTELQQITATEKYITHINNIESVRIQPYSMAKIKQKYKIDNSRFLYIYKYLGKKERQYFRQMDFGIMNVYEDVFNFYDLFKSFCLQKYEMQFCSKVDDLNIRQSLYDIIYQANFIVEAMRIYQDYTTEEEIISDSYPMTMLFQETTAEVQSKMVAKGDVDVDVGCGNAFGGKNQEEQEGGAPGAPPVEKVNDLIDAFGYLQTSYDKKDWQTYFKGYAKAIMERMTANKSPRLDAFKKGAGEFVKFISEKFNDITIYTPRDGTYDGSLIYSYWKNEEADAPIFLFFLDGMKSIKC